MCILKYSQYFLQLKMNYIFYILRRSLFYQKSTADLEQFFRCFHFYFIYDIDNNYFNQYRV